MGRRRGSTFATALALALLVAGGGDPLPRGDEPVKVGTTFSPERALAGGMDDLEAFQRLEAMGFAVIRLAVSWDAVDLNGFGRLDRVPQPRWRNRGKKRMKRAKLLRNEGDPVPG